MVPESIKRFALVFTRLPSIGPRMALRLAFFLAGIPKGELKELSDACSALLTVEECPQCFFFKDTTTPLCGLCSDAARDKRVLMIVEHGTDILSLEKMKVFRGLYFVFGDLPTRGALTAMHRARMERIKERVSSEPKDASVSEVIIAFPRNSFGDFATSLLTQSLQDSGVRVTRLGRGIPTGGEIEFADEETLRDALQSRR